MPDTETGTWVEIGRWEGSGNRKSDDFTIAGDRWRIVWSKESTSDRPGYITIFVHNSDGRFVSMAVNERLTDSGVAELHEGGDFYLDIVSRRARWRVKVEAME